MAWDAEVANAVHLHNDEEVALGIATTNDLSQGHEVIGGGNAKCSIFVIVKADSVGNLGGSGHGSTFLFIVIGNVNFAAFFAQFK